jgi:hypothetical protein
MPPKPEPLSAICYPEPEMSMPAVRSSALMLMFAIAANCALAGEMLAPGHSPSARSECDTQSSSSVEPQMARVIYHDGRAAPVSVPVMPRAAASMMADADADADADAVAADTRSTAGGGLQMPAPDPIVPQKPRNGLRWQSVLPGSIK